MKDWTCECGEPAEYKATVNGVIRFFCKHCWGIHYLKEDFYDK